MSLKNVLITGDCHGRVAERLAQIKNTMPQYKPEDTMVIILGDASLNYYLDSSDRRHKKETSKYGYTVYCVRGNHEARPCEKLGMHLIKDEHVNGAVWIEDEFPFIRYFADWGVYNIDGLRTLVIGGSYSVDKWYRLQNGWRWFEDEQLSSAEMAECEKAVAGQNFDLVLAHTCPLSLQPTDLFLHGLDQSTVDNSMEVWMEDLLRNKITWKLFLFGHYHADRVEYPHVEMFYQEIENLMDVCARWKKYDETGELDWWIPMSPSMKKIINKG